MTPLTTRARELAARERKLYDQRTIPAVLEELADEVERLTAALAEQHKERREMALQELASLGQAQEAYEAQLAATDEADRLRAEAANSAAQRDEVALRAEVAEERLRAVEADLARICNTAMKGQAI